MFDFRRLYNLKTDVQWYVQAYCGGMNHIARVTDGSGLNPVKADLGLAVLEKVAVAQAHASQYLHAQDAYGHQFFLALTSDIAAAWADVMQLGLSTNVEHGGKTLQLVRNWSEPIVTSIKTKVGVNDLVFLSGHGLAGAVMALAHIDLAAQGYKVQQTYMNGTDRFLTEGALPDFNGSSDGVTPGLPMWWMGFPEDELSWAPPGALSNPIFYGIGHAPVAELFVPGRGRNWARTGRARVAINDLVDHNDPLGWPANIPDAMKSAHSTDYYVRAFRSWITNNERNAGFLRELVNTLNANYAMGLPILGAE